MKSICSTPALLVACLASTIVSAQEIKPSLTGNWRGSYVCVQGKTGLDLIIENQSEARFSGYFHFYALPENPEAKEGCFAVTGRLNSDASFVTEAGNWIDQPLGYVTVDLNGKLAGTGKNLSGTVTGPRFVNVNCQSFSLKKTGSAPKIPVICRKGEISLLSQD